MKEADFTLPEGMDIEVHENGPDTIHEVLPIQQEGVLEAWKKFNPYGAKIIEKAWSDPQYKKKVFSDPRAAFLEVADIKPPDNLKLYVHENTESKFHIIVPYIIPAEAELGARGVFPDHRSGFEPAIGFEMVSADDYSNTAMGKSRMVAGFAVTGVCLPEVRSFTRSAMYSSSSLMVSFPSAV
jgi:hypothetical protein